MPITRDTLRGRKAKPATTDTVAVIAPARQDTKAVAKAHASVCDAYGNRASGNRASDPPSTPNTSPDHNGFASSRSNGPRTNRKAVATNTHVSSKKEFRVTIGQLWPIIGRFLFEFAGGQNAESAKAAVDIACYPVL